MGGKENPNLDAITSTMGQGVAETKNDANAIGSWAQLEEEGN